MRETKKNETRWNLLKMVVWGDIQQENTEQKQERKTQDRLRRLSAFAEPSGVGIFDKHDANDEEEKREIEPVFVFSQDATSLNRKASLTSIDEIGPVLSSEDGNTTPSTKRRNSLTSVMAEH